VTAQLDTRRGAEVPTSGLCAGAGSGSSRSPSCGERSTSWPRTCS